ncbi:MAG: ribosome hibernation-promoting factor, HPF/YfiA family [Desulfatiglandales bacterium]
MEITVTFRKTEPVDRLRAYAEEKLKRLEKYFDFPVQAHVVLNVEKYRHIADVTLNVDGTVLKAVEETEDMYSTLDLIVDKLEAQVKKHLKKVREKRSDSGRGVRGSEGESLASMPLEEPIIEVERVEVKPMDPVEAAYQLQISGKDFLVFRDSRNQEFNVIYRKRNGNFGLITSGT